jgi:hypothetical protein
MANPIRPRGLKTKTPSAMQLPPVGKALQPQADKGLSSMKNKRGYTSQVTPGKFDLSFNRSFKNGYLGG